MDTRKVRKVVKGRQAHDGAGVKLLRVLGINTVKDFDPFLMLDFFDSKNSDDYINGFPWHPHRGIETVTYLIDGEIDHGDSLGNKGKIVSGSCQWMTAGSGIIHQEMPQAVPKMLGAQLWINLPKKEKMTKPGYRDIKASMVKKIKEKTADIALISGKYKDAEVAITGDYVRTLYMDVSMPPKTKWELETESGNTLFVFIIKGSASFGGSDAIDEKSAVLFGKGKTFQAESGEKGARFLLLSAKALNESVAWGGPIVMNTEKELNETFEELKNGTFIKEKHPSFKV